MAENIPGPPGGVAKQEQAHGDQAEEDGEERPGGIVAAGALGTGTTMANSLRSPLSGNEP